MAGASWEDFVYKISHDSQDEDFCFQVYKSGCESQQELEELLSLYGEETVMLDVAGGSLPPISSLLSLEEAREMHESLCSRGSPCKTGTIKWRLSHKGNEGLESFIGVVGFSVEDHFGLRLLKPSICLKDEHQRKGLGPLALFCLLAKVLEFKTWFVENIQGLLLEYHPENEVCEQLRKRMFGEMAVVKKNPERSDGTWVIDLNDPVAKQTRLALMKRFIVKGPETLEMFFKSNVEQSSESPTLLTLVTRKTNKAKSTKGSVLPPSKVKKIEASLQDFSYTFNYEKDPETLTFRTYKKSSASIEELHNLILLYGDDNLMRMFVGTSGFLKQLKDAEKMRADFQTRISFANAPHSFYWQLFRETSTTVEFLGLIGLNLVKKDAKTFLNPDVLLLPQFQKKRFGSRLLTCVIHKLMSVKEWFVTLCDGLYVRISPENKLSLGLKDSLLANKSYEELNPDRTDGLWQHGPRKFDGLFIKTLMKRIVCPGVETLCALVAERFKLDPNKKDMLLLTEGCSGQESDEGEGVKHFVVTCDDTGTTDCVGS